MKGGDSWFDRQVSPLFLLVAGLLLVPTVIFQQHLLVKAIQTAFLLSMVLCCVSVQKFRLILGSSIFLLGTVTVNLLSPAGRVLVLFGPLRITSTALYLGLSKAMTVVCLLFLSRIFVRPSVQLPGIVGRYVAQTFSDLNRLLAGREKIGRRELVERLDELFQSILENREEKQGARSSSGQNKPLGLILLTVLLILNWGALFFPFSDLLAGLWAPIL